MHRRTALLSCFSMFVAACGGGGGGGIGPVDNASASPSPSPSPAPTPAPQPAAGPAPAPAPAPAPSSAPSAPQSSNVAVWGDSLTPAVALNLQVMMPDRTVFNGGFLGQTSTVIAAQQFADNSTTNWINVFWYGHNNDQDPATIKSDIAKSVAHLAAGNRRFIVLSMLNKSRDDEAKGTDEYWNIVKLDADLEAAYPDNYIDVRSWLVSHYDPNNAQDVKDHENDEVPSTLRYDEIHLRNEGSVLVAQRVKQFIDAKGW